MIFQNKNVQSTQAKSTLFFLTKNDANKFIKLESLLHLMKINLVAAWDIKLPYFSIGSSEQ